MSLIAENNTFAIIAVIFALAWLGFWADQHPVARKISGVVWVLVAAMLLSNLHVIPLQAPAYDFVGGTLVPLAIPLLLFKADLRRIFRESGAVMLTFCVAGMATVIGAVAGFYLLDLGEIGPKVAGVYTGGWIGGAVNFLAVSQAVEMTDDQFSVAISASSVVSISALMLLMLLPSIRWVVRMVPYDQSAHTLTAGGDLETEDSPVNFKLTHVSAGIAISCAICTVATQIGQLLDLSRYNILFITIITIIVANLFPRRLANLEGDFELGMLIMYLFFAIVGAGTDATSFLSSALILFVYGMIIIFVHLAVVLSVARLLKVDLAEAIIASAAALVGPAPTAAIAISRGWRSLVTPGIMCGIFGYVIANFIGVTVTAFLS
ncbi:MAG: DUF819 domain-containing protein [Pseudomonadales bacterium]